MAETGAVSANSAEHQSPGESQPFNIFKIKKI
jgi:hypothetical protein